MRFAPVAAVLCALGCSGGVSHDARSAEATPSAASPEQSPLRPRRRSELTRQRIQALNASCPYGFCGRSFMYRFHSLICQSDEARCLFGFRMVTEASTRGDLRPAEFSMDYQVGPQEHALEARIYNIEGPGTCSPYEEGTAGPCSAIEAVCVLYGIGSDAEYDQRHRAGLSQCVSELERDIGR